MKNTIKLFGVIALVAVIGFSFAACGGDDDDDNGGGGGGTFTLTNMPSQYNGKYAFIVGGNNDGIGLYGAQSINMSTETFTLPQIANGRVSIPLWLANESTNSVSKYSGNANVVITFFCFDKATVGDDDLDDFDEDFYAYFESVNLSNGSATKSWNDRVH
jgi:hypothetical protein